VAQVKCKKCQLKFEDYLSGKLSTKAKEKFESHLNICKECEKQFRILKTVDSTIENLQDKTTEVELPYGTRERILNSVKSLSERRIPLLIPRTNKIVPRISIATAIGFILIFTSIQFCTMYKKCPFRHRETYGPNNLIADTIAKAKILSEEEIANDRISEIIGLGKNIQKA